MNFQQDQRFPYIATPGDDEIFINKPIDKISLKKVAKRIRSNRNERKRNLDLNKAFQTLQQSIPYVPGDRQLPKVKTLRLAVNYIKHLYGLLDNGQTSSVPSSSTSSSSSSTSMVVYQSSTTAGCHCRCQNQFYPVDKQCYQQQPLPRITDFSRIVANEMLAKNSYTERAQADLMSNVCYWPTQSAFIVAPTTNHNQGHMVDYPYGGIPSSPTSYQGSFM